MTKNTQITIKKANGEKELFNLKKLQESLLHAGADQELVQKISENILGWIHEGVTTNMIYSRAYSILRKAKTKASFAYKLKQAILQFGSTGYPFEILIGQIFAAKGCTTSVGVILPGKCVNHEIDVVAEKPGEQHFVECKFSRVREKNISIQTPLYVFARMQDVIAHRQSQPEHAGVQFTGWLVSNIRFTSDAISYAKCAGLQLMSWNYPTNDGLKDRMEKAGIMPITLLNYLKNDQKKLLIEMGIVTCNELMKNPEALSELKLSKKTTDSLMQELHIICD